jgi:hypothetical protein
MPVTIIGSAVSTGTIIFYFDTMRYTTATILVVLFFAVFACSQEKPSRDQESGHLKIQYEPARQLQIKAVQTEAEVDSLLNII